MKKRENWNDPTFRPLVVRAMASVLISSSVDPSDQLACWRRLLRAGFTWDSISSVIDEVREFVKGRS